MTKTYDVMIAGHLCLDIIPLFPDTGLRKIEEIMRPGKLVNVQEAKLSTGGSVSNTGLNLKKLGCSVCFCACVGDDELGQITASILSKSGNAEGIHTRKGQASSYTVVVAPPGIDRIFLHNPGTNNFFTADDLNADLIRQCRHFHFGYPPLMAKMFADEGKELVKVFKLAKDAGATTSCDMTLPDPSSPSGKAPWRAILKSLLPYVDIYLPSIEESFYMLYPDEFIALKKKHNNADLIDFLTPAQYTQVADELLAMGTKITSLKTGQRGFYVKTGDAKLFKEMGRAKPGNAENWSNRELWRPAFTVDKFGSATGSGDSSIAGFLSAFLRGLDIEDALKYAACVGYQNVCVLDAVSGVKDWDTTTQMIQAGRPFIDVHIDADGWTHNDKHKLWVGPNDQTV